jgi:hypothetical protein
MSWTKGSTSLFSRGFKKVFDINKYKTPASNGTKFPWSIEN